MSTITTSEELFSFCQGLSGAEFVTVDTEFMRENTFWPILCLVQVAGPDDAAAIDVMAPNIDLAPLFDILKDLLCR